MSRICGIYQRLLARDQSEAAELIDSHIQTDLAASVYDALLMPSLAYAERDRLEHRLSSEEEAAVIDATRDSVSVAAESHTYLGGLLELPRLTGPDTANASDPTGPSHR